VLVHAILRIAVLHAVILSERLMFHPIFRVRKEIALLMMLFMTRVTQDSRHRILINNNKITNIL